MNPVLASSYGRAMQAALSGSGYPGSRPVSSAGLSAPERGGKSKRPLFDFTVDHLPSGAARPVDFVDAVFQRIRNQEWGEVFLQLMVLLGVSGIAIFFVRDRYYRRRGKLNTLSL